MILLAFHFPPMLGPASERAASFVRHLPASGWEPTVTTVKQGLYHRDPSHRPPSVRTVRTRSPEPSRVFAAFGRSVGADPGLVTESPADSSIGGVKRFVRDYVYVPDGQVLWIPFAVVGAQRALSGRRRPSVLLSSSVPYSAHLAALMVSRRRGLPWVAELRDPWSHVHESIRTRSSARRRIDSALEGAVVRSASAIVLTSELTHETMVRTYADVPEERFWVVRNGFEPTGEPVEPPPPRDGPLRLVYAGTVPSHVPIDPLLRGIDALNERHPGGIQLRVLGAPTRWRQAAQPLGDPKWLDLTGLVSPVEVRRVVRQASVNIVLCPGEAYEEHVAAKLLEYLGARRPVLGVVSGSGEMATLGRAYGDMRVVPDYSPAKVERALEELLAEHRRGDLDQAVNGGRPVAELSRAAQARRLAEVLEFAKTSRG